MFCYLFVRLSDPPTLHQLGVVSDVALRLFGLNQDWL